MEISHKQQLFTEITESEATNVVGGRFLIPSEFGGRPFIAARATGSSTAVADSDDAFQFATVDTFSDTTISTAVAGSISTSFIVFDERLNDSATN